MKALKVLLILTMALALIAGVATAEDLWRTAIERVYVERATGSGAVATTLAPGKAFQLLEVRVHLSSASATSENLRITMDAGAGAAYDSVLYSEDMDTVADLVVTFTDRYFSSTDELDIAWTNTDARTFGLEIIYKTNT